MAEAESIASAYLYQDSEGSEDSDGSDDSDGSEDFSFDEEEFNDFVVESLVERSERRRLSLPDFPNFDAPSEFRSWISALQAEEDAARSIIARELNFMRMAITDFESPWTFDWRTAFHGFSDPWRVSDIQDTPLD